MAGISSINPTATLASKRIRGIRCCSSGELDSQKKNKPMATTNRTPQFLKLAVSGVTELLRVLSPPNKEIGNNEDGDEISVSGVDDVIMILKSDYENAYFVTGIFTSAIYAEDCIFEDPTIRFQGTELYSRNLKLLVPFFDSPSIGLTNIEKGASSETNSVRATWKLRTYLKFPWRPLISIDGQTVYELDNNFKIMRHSESWNVSALEAIGQIFTPSIEGSGD
ncbi:hypothetical protein Tsubulata_000684 [Turnera subulata]|uniref:Uncharacterized protein n=1 Tax=Turnera subulata TaxID=218843 RepID=A0A9Q0FGX5_9ROSI|nr:hypothetical protein Tsubulata_000684 [Turnera subulata]